MEDRRGQLARDLVHVRQHEHEALRRREGRRHGARLQRAVRGTGCAAFTLHLDNIRDMTPDIFLAHRRPYVGGFRHR